MFIARFHCALLNRFSIRCKCKFFKIARKGHFSCAISKIIFTFLRVDISRQPNGSRTPIEPKAVIDNIGYSRVFSECYPGAIILHRGTRFLVEDIVLPPKSEDGSGKLVNMLLAAYASPLGENATSIGYKTASIQSSTFTIVRRFEGKIDELGEEMGSVGTGVINV